MRGHLARLSQFSKLAAGLQGLTLLYLLYQLFAAVFFTPVVKASDPGLDLGSASRVFTITWTIGAILLCSVIGVLNWFAAEHYARGTGYGFLKITALLNLVPCLSACVVGWLLGGYELLVLFSDDVKRVFEAVERGRSFADAMGAGSPGGSGRRASVSGDDDIEAQPGWDAPPLTDELLADAPVRLDLDDVDGAVARASARQADLARAKKYGGAKPAGTTGAASGVTPAASGLRSKASGIAPAGGTSEGGGSAIKKAVDGKPAAGVKPPVKPPVKSGKPGGVASGIQGAAKPGAKPGAKSGGKPAGGDGNPPKPGRG